MEDLSYLRTYGCQSAGCTDPAWAERGLHAPNCTQGEIDLALDEIDRLRQALYATRMLHAYDDDHPCEACREELADASR